MEHEHVTSDHLWILTKAAVEAQKNVAFPAFEAQKSVAFHPFVQSLPHNWSKMEKEEITLGLSRHLYLLSGSV